MELQRNKNNVCFHYKNDDTHILFMSYFRSKASNTVKTRATCQVFHFTLMSAAFKTESFLSQVYLNPSQSPRCKILKQNKQKQTKTNKKTHTQQNSFFKTVIEIYKVRIFIVLALCNRISVSLFCHIINNGIPCMILIDPTSGYLHSSKVYIAKL